MQTQTNCHSFNKQPVATCLPSLAWQAPDILQAALMCFFSALSKKNEALKSENYYVMSGPEHGTTHLPLEG